MIEERVVGPGEIYSHIDLADATLDGPDGLLHDLVRSAVERGLQAELSAHLGYRKGDADAPSCTNSRNGTFPKTVTSALGHMQLSVPRDRRGSFRPGLVPKRCRSLSGLDDLIVALFAGGVSPRGFEEELLARVTTVSRSTVVAVSEAIVREVTSWRDRTLLPFYPVIYLEAVVVTVPSGDDVRKKAAHVVVGVDPGGAKHVLGVWVPSPERAPFWQGVCGQLASRGLREVQIVCCDGIIGFPEAVESTWPSSALQTCVVHLIRMALRSVPAGQRRSVAAALVPVYHATDEAAAASALSAFAASPVGRGNRETVRMLEDAWSRFVPFLAFPDAVRQLIYRRIERFV